MYNRWPDQLMVEVLGRLTSLLHGFESRHGANA